MDSVSPLRFEPACAEGPKPSRPPPSALAIERIQVFQTVITRKALSSRIDIYDVGMSRFLSWQPISPTYEREEKRLAQKTYLHKRSSAPALVQQWLIAGGTAASGVAALVAIFWAITR